MAMEYDLGNVVGPRGEQGVSVTDAAVNDEGRLLVTLSSGAVLDAGHVRGAQGERGEQGARGDAGATGAAGKSAYEQAKEGGYAGTEAAFILELNAISAKADKSYVDALNANLAQEVAGVEASLSNKATQIPQITWKPVFAGADVAGDFTYTQQHGTCTIIGNTATIFAKIGIFYISKVPVGEYRIQGIPAAPKSSGAPIPIGYVKGGVGNSVRKIITSSLENRYLILRCIVDGIVINCTELNAPLVQGVQDIIIELGGTFEIA